MSLKNGGVSMTFHIPFDHAKEAFGIHELQGKAVTLQIKLDADS